MTVVGIEGGLSRDHIVTVGQGSAFDQIGGPGAFASIAAALVAAAAGRAGLPAFSTRLFAVLPISERTVFEALEKAGVDLAFCVPVGSIPRLWILNSPDGRRIVPTAVPTGAHELHDSQTEAPVRAVLPPADFYQNLSGLLRCSPQGAPAVAIPAGVVVAVDPDQSQLAERQWGYIDELVESTTVFLPSRVQLGQLGSDPYSAARALRERTGRSVLARFDAEGALALPAEGGAWWIRSEVGSIVDTTGAGDSHAAAALAALASPLAQGDLVNAATIAAATVAHTLSGWAADGLLAELHRPSSPSLLENSARVTVEKVD